MNKNIKVLFLLTTVLMLLLTVTTISAANNDDSAVITDDNSIISDDTSVISEKSVDVDNKNVNDNKVNSIRKAESTTNTHIVNNDNVDDIFNGDNYSLGESVQEGDVLDFQGSIDRNHSLIINKPINTTSTTNDALISLHTVAGSLLGEAPGNSFIINNGASGSNITSIYLNNTEFWVYNAHDTYFYNMSMVVINATVGSGNGQTAIRYSDNITLDSCFIFTQNNGGSSSFVWTGTSNSLIVNSTVGGTGNIGNLMYVGNTFNTNDKPAGFVVTSANNTINNCTINTTTSGGISIPIQNLAVNTTINNTKVYAAGSAISSGTNGTLTNCDAYLGAGITATAGSYLKNNTIHGTGAMTVAANSTVINSTLNTVTISGLNVTFENNTVKNKLTVSSRNNIKNNNLTEVQVNTAASNSSITFNNITGTVLSQAANVTIDNNNITTANDYTVTVTGANNKVTNNYLVTNVKAGKESINTTIATTIIENNIPEPGSLYEITDETYSNFFDVNGKLIKTDINDYSTLVLKGTFNDKIFDLDNLKLTLTGDEAIINNGYFKSTDSANILVQNLIINNTNQEHSVIFESDSNTLRNVTIYRQSSEGISQEVYITGNKNFIDRNKIYLDVETQAIDYDAIPSISKVSAITILSSNNKVANNIIKANTTITSYGTLNVIDIASITSSEYNNITNNTINVTGTDYIYGINLGSNTNYNNITSNTINLISNNYAAGIQLMNGPNNDNLINSNNINITAEGYGYGVLITAWQAPEVSSNTINSNKINVTASQAYAIEIYGALGSAWGPEIIVKNTTINSNTIKTVGNYSMGIALFGNDATISLNTINVTGTTNSSLADSYDLIVPTTAGIILKNSDNIQALNNTINVTNGANYILNSTTNSYIGSILSTMTRYINSVDNTNIILDSSNNNEITTQRAFTTGTYSVELISSNNNIISGNILNASNYYGGNNAVSIDENSKDNTVFNNSPSISLLTDETYSQLFDENGVYIYPEDVELLSLAGDLHNKNLTFTDNVTLTNSGNFTIYNGTIIINENPDGYINRFVTIRNININNTNNPALIDNLETSQQRNIQYYGGSISITGEDIIAIESVKDIATYAIIDVENATITLDGTNVVLAKMTRPTASKNDYIDIERNNITITAVQTSKVIEALNVNLDLLYNNITQTGKDVLTTEAINTYGANKFFGNNTITLTGDNVSALLLVNNQGTNPTIGDNIITITTPNPTTAINVTSTGITYVGVGSSTSYRYPNTIIVNADNGEVPVVSVTGQGYVRGNFILANDVWGIDAVKASTVSNITPFTTKVIITAPEDITAGEEVTITAKATNETNTLVSGHLVVKVDDEVVYETDGSSLTYTLTPNAGITTVKVEFTNTTVTYVSSSDEISLKAKGTILELNPIEAVAGNTITISAKVSDEEGTLLNGGKVAFKLNGVSIKDANGKVIYATVVDGIASLEYEVPEKYANKEYTLSAVYSGSSKNKAARNETTLTVTALEELVPEIKFTQESYTASVGEAITLKVNVQGYTSGKVSVKLNGKTLKDANGKVIYATVVDGIATIEYTIPANTKVNEYTLVATFTSGSNRLETNSKITITA